MKTSKLFKRLGITLVFAMLLAILALIYGVYWQVTQGESADYQGVKEAIIQYGSDLNEMRDYLYLPQNEYEFFQNDSDVDLSDKDAPEDNKYQTGVMMFAEALAEAQNLAKMQDEGRAALNELINDVGFNQQLLDLNLSLDKEVTVDETHARVKVSRGDQPVVQLMLDLDDKSYGIQSIRGVEALTPQSGQENQVMIVNYLRQNADVILELKQKIADQKVAMSDLLTGEVTQAILNENSLTLSPDAIEVEGGFEYYVTDMNGSPLLTVTLLRSDGIFEMRGLDFKDVTALEGPLMDQLNTLNGETDQLKMVRAKKDGLGNYLKSPAFLDTGLSASEPREEGTLLIYELIYTETQVALGQIIFDNLTGEIRFTEANSDVDYSLDEILSGSKKKP